MLCRSKCHVLLIIQSEVLAERDSVLGDDHHGDSHLAGGVGVGSELVKRLALKLLILLLFTRRLCDSELDLALGHGEKLTHKVTTFTNVRPFL